MRRISRSLIKTGVLLTVTQKPITAFAVGSGAGVSLSDILNMVSNAALVGGALWLVWGVIILAGALKDKNGPALQSGIWQIVGGGLILGAAALFKNITTTI